MHEPPEEAKKNTKANLEEQIRAKQERKLRARSEKNSSIWFGLGMFGMVGWSIAVPTVIAVAIGRWIDIAFPSRISWTLTFLFLGVVAGGFVAWNWVQKEGGQK